MSKPEQSKDVVQQSGKPEKKSWKDRLRGFFGGEKPKDIVENLADEVEAGETSLPEVAEAVQQEVATTSQETITDVNGMQETLQKEASEDLVVAELGALVVAEEEATSAVKSEVSEAKEEKIESLFERVANHATDVAGLDEVMTRLGEYQNPNQWGDGPGKDQLTEAFKNMPENSFCLGSYNNGIQEVFFTDASKNLKMAEVDTPYMRGGLSETQRPVVDSLKENGWRMNGYLGEIVRTVSEQQKKESDKKVLEEKREKIARGEFGKDGVEGFLAESQSVTDKETLQKAFGDFKGSGWDGDPNAEDLKKAMFFFDSLPVGACQISTTLNNSGVDRFNILYKAGNGELKQTSISVWDMDRKKADTELENIVTFSQSARRGTHVDDRVMKDRMVITLREKGFVQVKNLFGEVQVPLGRILKPKE